MAKKRQTSADSKSQPSLEASFFRSGEKVFTGYVVDPVNPWRIYTVDVLIDGIVVKTALANEYVHELATRKIGDACYGFSLSLDSAVIDNASVIEARLSNLGTQIGAAIVLPAAQDEPDREGPGALRWLGGLRFSGWVNTDSATAPTLDAIVDGVIVARIKALGWTHVNHGGDRGRAARAFDFHLPDRFADGRVHHVAVVKESGESIHPAPLPFVAFADGLAQAIAKLGDIDAERFRGELFDRLLPMSVPMAHYDSWCERFPIPAPAPVAMKGAVILIGPGNIGMTLPSLEEQTHDDWVAASLLAGAQQTGFDPEEARTFLESEGGDCDFVLFAPSGTRFATNALARIADVFDKFEDADIVYGDVDIVAQDGGRWPLAFPAFDYERMLEQGYCAHLFAMRLTAAQQSLARGASESLPAVQLGVRSRSSET